MGCFCHKRQERLPAHSTDLWSDSVSWIFLEQIWKMKRDEKNGSVRNDSHNFWMSLIAKKQRYSMIRFHHPTKQNLLKWIRGAFWPTNVIFWDEVHLTWIQVEVLAPPSVVSPFHTFHSPWMEKYINKGKKYGKKIENIKIYQLERWKLETLDPI